MAIKVGTDFSGLGSPEEAIKRLQVEHSIEFACEIDTFARNSYNANHDAKIFYEDVTKRDNRTAQYVDLYAFGFPCQSFSISGKRLGFEDTRGTLFYSSLSYIKEKRPRVFIAENVKGLLSHDKPKGSKSKYGKTFGAIRDALALTVNGQHNLYKYVDCVNYHIHFQVLNTKDYGLPQNRERIFIVGFRDEEDSIKFSFPKKLPLQVRLKDLLEKNLPEKYYLSEAAINRLLKQTTDLADSKDGDCFAWQNATEGVVKKEIAPTLKSSSGTDIRKRPVIIQGEFELANSRTRMAKSTDSILINEVEEIEKNEVLVVNEKGNLRDIGEVTTCLDANYVKGMDNHGQRTMIVEDDFEVKVSHRSRTEEAKEIRKENRKKGNDTNPFVKKEVSLKETPIMNTITASKSDDQLILIETPLIEDNSILFDKENTAKGYTQAEPGDSINFSNPNSTTRRGRVGKQIAQTLDTACNQAVLLPLFGTGNNADAERIYSDETISRTLKSEGGGGGAKTGLYLTNKRIRRLTPRECFFLQGYSNDFFEKCALINSDTRLYMQAGNSISVDTIMHLLIQIFKAINVTYIYNG